MLARRDEAWSAAAVLMPDGVQPEPEPEPELEPEPDGVQPGLELEQAGGSGAGRDAVALRSLQQLLLAVARENLALRRAPSRAVELRQGAGGRFELHAGGAPWAPCVDSDPAGHCARSDDDDDDDGTPAEELSEEERAKMESAMAAMAAMNGEVDRARAAGKLIEPAGRAASRPALSEEEQTDGASAAPGPAAAGVARMKGSIGSDSFTRLGMLGKGAVGKVYLVREKGTNQLYAMKCMGKADITQRSKNKRIMLEREVMTMSQHPLVVSLHASFQSTDFLYHVMEYCPGGPLFGVLKRQPYCRFDEQTTRFYVAETVLALEYLHLQGYMYRDLKPENILISAQGHIRLSDFDLVRPMVTVAAKAEGQDGETSLLSEERASSFVGTAEYVAPEIIRRNPYTMTAEWWSVGILTYEMVSGYTPFVARTTAATFRRILSADVRFRDDIPLTKECKRFISGCLQGTPSLRLGDEHGAADLKASRWMRGIEWSLLANTERPPYIPIMPLMPEERDGAGIEDEQRSAAENAAVADRYRLYGRHFIARSTNRENSGIDTTAPASAAAPADGAVPGSGMENANPFAGFDWMAKDLAQRRNGQSGMMEAEEEQGRDNSSGTGQQHVHDGLQKEKPAQMDKASSLTTNSASTAEAPGATSAQVDIGTTPNPGENTNVTAVPTIAPVALKVSPIAAETGFDFGVPGCHHLPVSSSTASLDGVEDGNGGGAAACDSATHTTGHAATAHANATMPVGDSSGSPMHSPDNPHPQLTD